jgi:5-formyltetrahydrofolate cyclo-ligase
MGTRAGEPPTKEAIRTAVLSARRRRSDSEEQRAAELLRDRVLDLPEVAAASTVAAYISVPGEPGTGPLISAWHAYGTAVLCPVLQADRSLRWAVHQPGRERVNSLGIPEPVLNRSEQHLASATVVICPGVAGDRHGHRLGRGGGSFDRALAATRANLLRCLLLYDEEVIGAVPTEPHDQPVDVIVTPERTLRVVSS